MANFKTVKTAKWSVMALPSESDYRSSTTTMQEANGGEAPTPAPALAPESKKKKNKGSQQQQSKKEEPQPRWTDELQSDLDRIVSVGEECISPSELQTLLLKKGRGNTDKKHFILYDGFEPSGRMHIAQGVFKAMNVNKCTSQGSNGHFCFWVADWFALMNDKMGGDLEKIKTVGHYLIEVWKAAGMNLEHVEFKWASAEITQHAHNYWPLMLDIARRFTISRIKKCCQIMGRLEGNLTAAQVLYPLMQCTDVFFLQADICQLGVDQRKVNMLAREYCDFCKRPKPIILSHHMLYGLKAGQEKMSKSDPDSAIFMEDAAEDVKRKISNAYCPATATESQPSAAEATNEDAGKESMHLTGDTLKNPCLDYIQHIIFAPPGATFSAADKTYTEFATVKSEFLAGAVSEADLKQGLIDALNSLLEPVRQHFTRNERAKDLLGKVQTYKKQSATPSTSASSRRLDLVGLGKVPANAHLVLAPPPSTNPSLQQALDVIAQLQAAESGRPCVLLLEDWSARVQNACQADLKGIDAFYKLFVAWLNALNPALMEQTCIITQSDAILADPSNYWISVINVGRHFQLDDIAKSSSLQDSDSVGHVIATLLRVANVVAVTPASVALPAAQADLVKQFFGSKLPSLAVPTAVTGASAPPVRLQPVRESAALALEHDEYFLLDDPKVHGKSKMKKAFCEPGNVGFCPPISVVDALSLQPLVTSTATATGSFVISRSPDNGGDKTYTTLQDLQQDFASQSLHPGDLKAATTKLAVSLLETVAGVIKADKDVTKASKDLKALQKKLCKMKK